jgi:hypothetical protein
MVITQKERGANKCRTSRFFVLAVLIVGVKLDPPWAAALLLGRTLRFVSDRGRRSLLSRNNFEGNQVSPKNNIENQNFSIHCLEKDSRWRMLDVLLFNSILKTPFVNYVIEMHICNARI